MCFVLITVLSICGCMYIYGIYTMYRKKMFYGQYSDEYKSLNKNRNKLVESV